MKAMTSRQRTGTGALFALLLIGAHAGAQDTDELARCSAIEDAGERLACYDAAARPDEPAQEEIAVLTDEVGEEQLDRKQAEEDDRVMVRGKVTNCQRDASGRYYFYFDNGQVWKQKDSDRLPFRICNFEVRIERDFFGYKMRVDGKKQDIRISRVK